MRGLYYLVVNLFRLSIKSIKISFRCVSTLVNKELAKLYSEVEVAVCPPRYESFLLSPLEAMAWGSPLVTTRYGTGDYCVHGENSLVVPPRKPEDIGESIFRLLEDRKLSDKLIKNGIKTAQQFTWDKTVDKVEDLFKGIRK